MANGNHKVEIIVGVKDLASNALKKIGDSVGGMSKGIQKSGSALSSFNHQLDNTIRKLDKMANSMYRFNMYTSSIQRNLKAVGAVAAIGGGALAVESSKKAVDYEHQMYKMQNRMGVNDAARKDIANYILGLNANVGFSATDLGDMAITLGSAGVRDVSGMKSLLKTTSYFAEAVDAVPEEAANMIISAANGFNISLQDSMKIADKLTLALNNSQLKVEELPHAIGEISGRAKMYGQSLESSMTALMAARDQGLPAAQAAQNFIHGLSKLSGAGRPDLLTPKRAEVLEKAGVSLNFFDLEKKQLKEYPELVAEFEKQMMKAGLMPNKDEFYKKIQANGGILPDDIINKMQMSPLLAKVLGLAGQTPFIMGLQSKYDIVDKNTGETTKTLYGADALKARRDELKNSAGTVEEQHKKMTETTKFALEQLGSSWENAQIKLMNNFLPAIRVASGILTDFIDGKDISNSFDRINNAIEGVSKNLAETNPKLAKFVEHLGKGAVGATAIAYSLGPTFNQIGESAINNIQEKDWGNSLLTLPYYVVKNGLGFIGDVTSGNPESDKAINNLPPELQDNAQLMRKLIQGGVVLLAAGAIIKVIELAIRTASTALKGAKIATTLGEAIMKAITGGLKGTKPKDIAKDVFDTIKDNKVINANIVNVYGKAVNGGGNGNRPGGNAPGNRPMPRDRVPGGTPGAGEPPKGRPGGGAVPLLIGAGLSVLGGYISDAWRDKTKDGASGYKEQNVLMDTKPQKPNLEYNMPKQQNSKEDAAALKNYLTNVSTKTEQSVYKMASDVKNGIGEHSNTLVTKLNGVTNTVTTGLNNTSNALSAGLANVSASIRNIKINNNLNISFSPNINVPGGGTYNPTIPQTINNATGNGPKNSGIQAYINNKNRDKVLTANNRRLEGR